jgi:hypothetical protein
MSEKKPWYQSKTVWFNALAMLVAVVQGLGGPLPEVDSAEYATVITLVNVALRVYTTKALSATKE